MGRIGWSEGYLADGTEAADIYITDEEAESIGGELTKRTEMGGFKIEYVAVGLVIFWGSKLTGREQVGSPP